MRKEFSNLGLHNKDEMGKRTALLFWLRECGMGHYSFKKRKKRHLIQPHQGGVAAVIQEKWGGRVQKPKVLGATRTMLVSGR